MGPLLAEAGSSWAWNWLGFVSIPALVALNALFVAAEFSLVAVRKTRIEELQAQKAAGVKTVTLALHDPGSSSQYIQFRSKEFGVNIPQLVITGVADYGFFAQAEKLPVEGMVHVSTLGDDYYYFDEATHSLIGRRTKRRYRLGDKVRVSVVRPGFVHSRMTEGMKAAPLSQTPGQVADVVVDTVRNRREQAWAPAQLRWVMTVLRHLPRAVFRRLPL